MRIALITMLVVGCGGGGPTHWNKQPLEAQEGTNDGITFTVDLPKGMKKSSVESKYSVEWGYHADVGGENRVFAPSFSVSKAAKKETLDEAIKGDTDVKAPTDVVWKEETANGWVYAVENTSRKGKEDYMITGQTNISDTEALRCSVRIFPMTKGGTTKADIPLIAKMCQSMKRK